VDVVCDRYGVATATGWEDLKACLLDQIGKISSRRFVPFEI